MAEIGGNLPEQPSIIQLTVRPMATVKPMRNTRNSIRFFIPASRGFRPLKELGARHLKVDRYRPRNCGIALFPKKTRDLLELGAG
jgi:hypothetical protein